MWWVKSVPTLSFHDANITYLIPKWSSSSIFVFRQHRESAVISLQCLSSLHVPPNYMCGCRTNHSTPSCLFQKMNISSHQSEGEFRKLNALKCFHVINFRPDKKCGERLIDCRKSREVINIEHEQVFSTPNLIDWKLRLWIFVLKRLIVLLFVFFLCLIKLLHNSVVFFDLIPRQPR